MVSRNRCRAGLPTVVVPTVLLLLCPALAAQWAPTSSAEPAEGARDWDGWYAGAGIALRQGSASALTGLGSMAFGHLDGGPRFGARRVLFGRLLVGAELSAAFPNFLEGGVVFTRSDGQGGTLTENLDYAGTLSGRLGYAFDRVAVYGVAGVTLSQLHLVETAAARDAQDLRRLVTGPMLGAGVVFRIAPRWAASLEYWAERFADASVAFPAGSGVTLAPDVRSLHVGLSYLLGGGHTQPVRPDAPPLASDQDTRWNLHWQDTFIEQGYPAFHSPYEGANSLTGASQAKNTESATAFLDVRLWKGADWYFDPELDQGFGLNDTHGVAAFTNGEAQKANFPIPRLVVDRLVLRQTFGLGGAQEEFEDGENQNAGREDVSRITLAVGRLSVTDYFDANDYANDPEIDFLNWNLYGAGAYDWTADQISWTWGAEGELNEKNWAFRAGYFLVPLYSGSSDFDMHLFSRGEYTAEGELRYHLGSQPGAVRLFGWMNRAMMGSYTAALALPPTTPNYPDITLTREVRTNPGYVINVQQALSADLGLFSRYSWSPGHDEILAGTDCSESWSLGGVLQGQPWGRPRDLVGLGATIGALSSQAEAYFAAGGLGILIGDGQLDYSMEKVLESFYSLAINRWATLSVDYQFVADPGYNADRGPVSIFAVRAHLEF